MYSDNVLLLKIVSSKNENTTHTHTHTVQTMPTQDVDLILNGVAVYFVCLVFFKDVGMDSFTFNNEYKCQ